MSTSPFDWAGTDEHFVKAHDEFQDKSGEHSHLLDELCTYFPTAMENTYESVLAHHGINILSIGSADGQMDIEILKVINNAVKNKVPSLYPIKMFNRAVEPLENQLRIYKTKTENLPHELKNSQIVFDIEKPSTFADYIAQTKDTVPFHIVHFFHSIYFLDMEKALMHCYDHELTTKGVVLLVVAENCAILRVMKVTKQLPFEEGDIGREVARIAHKNGWRYDVKTKEFPIDVTQVFDESSQKGNLLLDFLTYTMNFRANSNKEAVDTVLEIIKNNSTYANGKWLANNLNRIYMIYKD